MASWKKMYIHDGAQYGEYIFFERCDKMQYCCLKIAIGFFVRIQSFFSAKQKKAENFLHWLKDKFLQDIKVKHECLCT